MEWKDLSRLFSKSRKETIKSLCGNTVGRVVAVNTESIDVQPVLNKKVRGQSIKFPLFKNVPPLFMQGGAHYEAHPIAVGDYCLLVVCERCFDAWYDGQDEVLPPDDRMWDYSDCFAIVGINPLGKVINIPQVTTRRGDNDIEGNYIHRGNYDLTGTETHTGERNHTGNTNQTGNFNLNGIMAITNSSGTPSSGSGVINWTGDIVLNGISLNGHIHSGVQAGGDNSGGMV